MNNPKFKIGDWVKYADKNIGFNQHINGRMGLIQSEPHILGNKFWYKVYFIGIESSNRVSGLFHLYESDLVAYAENNEQDNE